MANEKLYISKIKLAGEDTARNIKDAEAQDTLSTLLDGKTPAKLGAAAWEGVADSKTATTGLAPITTVTELVGDETTRATGVESGLDTRISNLEARGRFLSKFDVATGHPTTDPTIPSTATSPYTYAFKTGDYYIVGNVPSTGKKYMPSGANIIATKSGDTWSWNYDDRRAETEATISTGDQFVYDGASWTHIAAAKDVAWGNITGTLSEQTDLQSALDAKLKANATVAGLSFSTATVPAIAKSDLQTALGLEDLAYADTASGSYTPEGSISEIDATPAGTIALGDFTQTPTDATLTKADYTPAGTITGTAISGGSILVELNDITTPITNLSYDSYTPAGDVSFEKDNTSGTFQVSGTISAPTITVDDSAKDTFVKSLKAGTTDAASFTEGTFTPASIKAGFYTEGSAATWTGNTYTAPTFTEGAFTAASYDAGFLSTGATASFIQGSKATLTAQSTSKFNTDGIKAKVGEGTDSETLIFEAAATADAVTDRGTFTANGDDTFVTNTLQTLDADKFHGGSKAADTWNAGTLSWGTFAGGTPTVIDTSKFSGGSKDADTFSAQKLPVVDATASAVTGVSATASVPVFTGDKFIPSFAGTSANIKLKGADYLKQTIKTATFTATPATLGFSGTTAASILVTGVKYDRATANGATFTGTSNKITPTFTGTAATITVTPDGKTV